MEEPKQLPLKSKVNYFPGGDNPKRQVVSDKREK